MKNTKATVDTHKNNQTQKIRIRWIDRSPKQAQAAQATQQIRPELPELNVQLDKARKLNILRDAELGALLSERWQLARERREVAAERQDLRHERWELLQSRWTGWLQSLKSVMTVNVHKPHLPRMDKLSKLTPIGQGILIWGFSGMALIGIGFLIARMRRRAAELKALDDMQDGAQLSVAKAIYTPHQKKSKSVKPWN